MNRRQKLVQQQFLNNEQAVIRRLQQVYGVALKDINGNIERLMKRFDPLTGDLPQSAVYQIKYQKMLKGQIEGILNQMQTGQYLTVSDYLNGCYEDGFVGSLFDLHGQGVPLAMPLDQEAMVRAVQLNSKISQGLYTRLGEDVDLLKKKITAQVSRSVATGVSYEQTAIQLAGYTRIGYNNAIRIARTEGHRIQCTAADDAAHQAKERGADVLKQWDATLDGLTRESHVAVDGEFRELNERFSNGLMFPGDPAGGAAEVVNCRCAYLQRARWAMGGKFTKMNNFTGQLETFDSPQAYDEFKKGFFSPENKDYMNYVQQMQDKYGTKDFRKVLDRMTEREYNHYSKLLKNNPLFNVTAPEDKYSGLSYDELTGIIKDKEKQLKNLQALKSKEELNFMMGDTEEAMEKARQKVLELQKQIDDLTAETDAIRAIWELKKPVKNVDPAKLDDFPEYFRKSSASKKATQTFVDALNEVEDLDPNIRKLYTHMGDLPQVPADCSISYTGKDHALARWQSTRTGETTKCQLKVPKMQGDDLMGQKSTAFHEMGHFVDMGVGDGRKLKSTTYKPLTDAIKSSGSAMGSDVKDLFDDFAKQYQKVKTNLQVTYGEKRQALTDAFKAGQVSWSDYNKRWKALTREQELERDYQSRNLCGGGMSMLSDIYDALSGGSHRDRGVLIYGHGEKYYRRPGSAESEIFANYMSLSVNRPDLVDVLREDKPDLCNALDKMIEEMAGGI